MKAAILMCLFLAGCYSVPVVKESDTTGQQDDLRKAAEDLHRIPANVRTIIGVNDNIAIETAAIQLEEAAATLRKKDAEINACAASLTKAGDKYREITAALAECQTDTGIFGSLGFFGRIGLRIEWFLIGALSALIGSFVIKIAKGFAA